MPKKPTKNTAPEPMDAEAARKVARLFLTGCALAGELAQNSNNWRTENMECLANWCVGLADATLKKLDL